MMSKTKTYIIVAIAFILIGGIGFLSVKKNAHTEVATTTTELHASDTLDSKNETIASEKTSEHTEEEAKIFSDNLASVGKNEHGQRGETTSTETTSLLMPVEIDKTFTKIGAGRSHGVGITSDGDVYTWGRNNLGQLGYKTDDTQYNPIPHLVMSDASDIAVGQDHTLILKKDGTVWGFGSNYTGALGDGTNTDQATPVKVKDMLGIAHIFTGYKFSMAIANDGKVYAWGATCAPSSVRVAADIAARINTLDGGYYDPVPSINPNGYDHNQDCINEAVIGIHSKSPVEMKSLSGVTKDISIGYGHALILQKDGSVWSFGCNLYGQMGNRTYNNKVENAKPQKILDIANVKAVSAGFRHSLAVTEDGKVYMWGINAKLEDGKRLLNSSSPVEMKTLDVKNLASVHSGYDISFALMKDGAVYAWGANTNHVVNNAPDQMLAPTLMQLSKKIKVLAPGIDTVLFLTK